jgi:hypothetical protein
MEFWREGRTAFGEVQGGKPARTANIFRKASVDSAGANA